MPDLVSHVLADERRTRAPSSASTAHALRRVHRPVPRNRRQPRLQIRGDLDLVRHLDTLGYDEAWIGEHHSAGYETVASPEVFIAAAAELTRRIRLGTGVNSLPYHHP